MPIEVFLYRPNLSLYIQPARQDNTAEECDFLDNAHLDVEGTSGDEECVVRVECCDAHSEGTKCHADGELDCITPNEPVPSTAESEPSPDDYPIQIQWTAEVKFDIGESV